jgi:hypothetical protein
MQFARVASIAAFLAIAACRESPSAPTLDTTTTGPSPTYAFGIVSGNHQTLVNSQAQSAGVTARLVKKASGALALISGSAASFDGTTVTGSPVAGAVVCAVTVSDTPLTPFVPCTNTDANGQATFFFSTGTKAGTARAEIRGTVANAPTVFDTAVATVLPDSVTSATLLPVSRDLGTLQAGSQLDLATHVTNAKDRYSNVNAVWVARYVFSPDSLVGNSLPSPLPAMPDSGRVLTVPSGARTLYFRVDKLVYFLKLRTTP